MIENVYFLCGEEENVRERRGYIVAFRKKCNVVLVEYSAFERYIGIDTNLFSLPSSILIYPDNYYPRIPLNFDRISIPLICFHFDTYADTKTRIEYSRLFDYTFVSHPEFVNIFKNKGIENTFLLPHAFEIQPFLEQQNQERVLDIGWVGRLDGIHYRDRKEIVVGLSKKFKMNEVHRSYNYEELSRIYSSSKLGINFSRSDYPQDANLRCFEIMAGGALLLTSLPTELTRIGYEEGIHFIGYKEVVDLEAQIVFFLSNPEQRTTIANAGKMLTLSQHTYDSRVSFILSTINSSNPARIRIEERVEILAKYYCRKNLFTECFSVLQKNNYLTFGFRLTIIYKIILRLFYRSFRVLFRLKEAT